MANAINWLGRAVGVISASGLAAAWAVVVWVPSSGLTLTGVSVIGALMFLVLAVFAGIASAYGHATVVALAFLASFFPIGVSLLPREHWLQWAGWLDLGLLVAAVLIWSTRGRLEKPA
ncbi:MAG TPA: hypothetical protein VF405_14710 [Gammaproteobacteria bacterium]